MRSLQLQHHRQTSSNQPSHNHFHSRANSTSGRIVVIAAQTKGKSLVVKSHILLDRAVVAPSIGDVDLGKVVGHVEEHVVLLGDVLESLGVVGEFVTAVGG